MKEFARLIAPYVRRIGNMLSRGTVAAVNAASKMQGLQLRLLADEVKDSVEHFEPYGFTSHPNGGAEAVAVFLDGDRSHGIVEPRQSDRSIGIMHTGDQRTKCDRGVVYDAAETARMEVMAWTADFYFKER